VLPGRRAVIFTNNDDGYRAALDLKIHGADVTVVDPRSKSTGALPQRAAASGVAIVNQAVVVEARGKWRVRGVTVARYANGRVGERIADLGCDLVGMSGGWNPVLHLFAQSGGKALWQDDKACFIPGTGVQPECSAGAARGAFKLLRRSRTALRPAAMRRARPGSRHLRRRVGKRTQRRRNHCCRSGWSPTRKPRRAARSASSISRTTWRRPTSCWRRAKAITRSST
jgi:NADPH-dependent 2,4-dienoyl-CoA reductase/sulfur reductase-like enzyme